MSRTKEQALALLNTIPVDTHGYLKIKGFMRFKDYFPKNNRKVGRRTIHPSQIILDHDVFLKERMLKYVVQGPPSSSLRDIPVNKRELLDFVFAGELSDDSILTNATGSPSDDLPVVVELNNGLFQVNGDGNHRVLWAWLYDEPIDCMIEC